MTFIRRSRMIFWLIRGLAIKYTRSLLVGFAIGFIVSFTFWRIYPTFLKQYFYPTIRIGLVGDFTPSTLPRQIQNQISSGLTRLNPDGDVVPGLAMSWEATNSGKLFIFHLRNDLSWQDGQKMTAMDVNYNIKDVHFKKPDNWTIEASLDEPYGPFPVLVSKPLFRNSLIGFGDYKICCLNLNGETFKSLKLLPIVNDYSTPDIEYHFYRTENQAIMAYKLGEIDELDEITDPGDLVKWGKTQVIPHTKYNRITAIFFNLKNPLLSEKNFREALGYALPKFTVERAYQPIPKTSWAYTDKVRQYEPDATEVDKLLKASKIGTSSAQLTLSAFSQYLDDAQSIADSWTKAGIKTSVKVENTIPPDYEALLTAFDVPPDPDQYQYWHSTQISTNITGYVNVKIDKLLEDGRQTTDIEARKKIYADFARRLVDDSPALFLYYAQTFTIKRH
jgi:peptide/nickel transport system substrate-binding protein